MIKVLAPYIFVAFKSLGMLDSDKKKNEDDIVTGWYLFFLFVVVPVLFVIFMVYRF